MKNAKWMLPVTLALLSGLMAAQSLTSPRVAVKTTTFKTYVPFEFVTGNQTLPSGTYQIQRLMGRPGDADEFGMIVVRNADARVYKAVVTRLGGDVSDSHDNGRLVFTLLVDQHYLAEIRMDNERGHEIPAAVSQSDAVGSDAPRDEIVLAALH